MIVAKERQRKFKSPLGGALVWGLVDSLTHSVGHLETKPRTRRSTSNMNRRPRWGRLALSSNSKQIFTHNSSEYIQFDEPETLINAIHQVYDQTKRPVG